MPFVARRYRRYRRQSSKSTQGMLTLWASKPQRASVSMTGWDRLTAKNALTTWSATQVPDQGAGTKLIDTIINGIAEGNDTMNRRGRSVIMTGIKFNYELLNPAAIAKNMRIILYYDVAPTGTDTGENHLNRINEQALNGAIPQAAIISTRNDKYLGRYKVLYDAVHDMGPLNSINDRVQNKIWITCRLPVQYTAATYTNEADFVQGALHCIVLQSAPSGETAGVYPWRYLNCRVFFNNN